MGKILNKLKVARDLVVTSPANHPAMTARIIADMINSSLEKIRYSETIYNLSEDDLIHVIRQIDDNVIKPMVVSHNPALTDLANTTGDTNISNIPTCGVCCLNLNISSWENINAQCGKLKFFEFPKKHMS